MSILSEIRELLVGDSTDESFDAELKMDINMALSTLVQVGVGPQTGFRIVSGDETWEDFLGDDIRLEAAKEYTKLKVRILFDPPSSSFVLTQFDKEAEEALWRVNAVVDDQTGRRQS